jgi:hypothetical protein
MAENTASSGLFAVFLLSIYSLFLIPYTIYRLCAGADEVTTQPVVKVSVPRCCCVAYWPSVFLATYTCVLPHTNHLLSLFPVSAEQEAASIC